MASALGWYSHFRAMSTDRSMNACENTSADYVCESILWKLQVLYTKAALGWYSQFRVMSTDRSMNACKYKHRRFE